MEPIVPLHHLPSARRHKVQDVVEQIGMHGDPTPTNGGEMEHILDTPLNTGKKGVWTPTRAWSSS